MKKLAQYGLIFLLCWAHSGIAIDQQQSGHSGLFSLGERWGEVSRKLDVLANETIGEEAWNSISSDRNFWLQVLTASMSGALFNSMALPPHFDTLFRSLQTGSWVYLTTLLVARLGDESSAQDKLSLLYSLINSAPLSPEILTEVFGVDLTHLAIASSAPLGAKLTLYLCESACHKVSGMFSGLWAIEADDIAF